MTNIVTVGYVECSGPGSTGSTVEFSAPYREFIGRFIADHTSDPSLMGRYSMAPPSSPGGIVRSFHTGDHVSAIKLSDRCTCLPARRTTNDGPNTEYPAGTNLTCPQHADRTSTIEASIDDAATNSRAILAALFERIRAAVHETRAAGDRPWDSGPVAVRWLEHEISPLLAAYEARFEKTQTGQLHPCPLCDDGEAEIQELPCIVEYSCGHRVSLAPTTNEELSEAQMASIIRRMQQAAASANPSLSREGEPFELMLKGDVRREVHGECVIDISVTDEVAIHTGRRRYRVHCTTCNETVHEATTGPEQNVDFHLRRRRDPDSFRASGL